MRFTIATIALFGLAAFAAAAPPHHTPGDDNNTVHLGNADNGKPASAIVGQKVMVFLKNTYEDGLKFTASKPVSSDAKVLAPKQHPDEPTKPPGGDAGQRHHHHPHGAHAAFEAASAGTATLSADRKCEVVEQGKKCPDTVEKWSVTVTVAAKSP